MKNYCYIFLLLILIVVIISGCTKSDVNVDGSGIIKEIKELGEGVLSEGKEGLYTLIYMDWSKKTLSLSGGDYDIIYPTSNDAVEGVSMKIICEFSSDEPVSIYAIPFEDINNAREGLNFGMYPPCSSRNTKELKCGEACIVPLNTAYFIKNDNLDSKSKADVKVNLRYGISNTTSIN